MRRGYTLVEVVAVLFVLGLAAAVVVPGIGRGTEALRARAEVAGFSAFLRYAREQAVTRRETHEVKVDLEARVMRLAVPGSDKPSSYRRLGKDLRIEADPPSALTVRFLPHGLSSGGTFRIGAAGGRIWVVTVDPLTGRVLSRRPDV